MKAHLLELATTAPAKANLSLSVVGRLRSGLHLLRSLICPLSLADDIRITLVENSSGVELECTFAEPLQRHIERAAVRDPAQRQALDIIASNDNLAVRAAQLFMEAFELTGTYGVRLQLHKRIPFQAGLGGGSADAAAVLYGLARAFGIPDHKRLFPLAARLGADVSALILRQTAYFFGTGRNVIPVNFADDDTAAFYSSLGVVIVKPVSGVSTAQAYAALGFAAELDEPFNEQGQICSPAALERELNLAAEYLSELGLTAGSAIGKKLTLFPQEGSSGMPDCRARLACLVRNFINDFQRSVVGANEEIRQIFGLLNDRAEHTMLAGSGSAVLGFTKSPEQAEQSAEVLRAALPQDWYITGARLAPVVK